MIWKLLKRPEPAWLRRLNALTVPRWLYWFDLSFALIAGAAAIAAGAVGNRRLSLVLGGALLLSEAGLFIFLRHSGRMKVGRRGEP